MFERAKVAKDRGLTESQFMLLPVLDKAIMVALHRTTIRMAAWEKVQMDLEAEKKRKRPRSK